jgi:hypothetical protein
MFAPDKTITRQEMFTLLHKALLAIGEPVKTTNTALTSFTDAADIATWAQDAVTALVQSGVITGSGGALKPNGTTTRAEMAQVLCRLLSA